MTLHRRLALLEARMNPIAPAVWFEDLDGRPGTMVNDATGERRPLADAGRLPRTDILVRYVEDWRTDHDAGA